MTFRISTLLRCAQLTGAALLSATLIACGGGSQNDPWQSFTQQKLDWQACDPTLMGEGENELTQLGERAQCTLMRAPLDYENLAAGELKVALFRVTAGQQRRGAIWFNPGGPGGDGLTLAAQKAARWSNASPDTSTGRLVKSLADSYDLIGFSPRGVGSSSELIWSTPELLEITNSLIFDRSAQNLKNVQYNARLAAKAAAKNPLSPHINTDATARDMDLMRELFGDAKINYIGYSYGTWLGTWYASLFPERVGRMLLDSSMNVVGSFDDNAQLAEMSTQRAIDDVILPYVARHSDWFNLGSSASQLRENLLALPLIMKQVLFSAMDFADSANITGNGLYMTAAIGLQALRELHPQASQEELEAKIKNHVFTPSSQHNPKAVEMAVWLTGKLFSTPKRESLFYKSKNATHWSVRCNDTSTRGNEQYWIDRGNESAARYPFSGGELTLNPCLYWDAPVKIRPSLTNARMAGPLLMLQSRFDALTAYEGAMTSFDALPNASMIMVEKEYKHGLFPYGDDCVDEKVVDYFLYGKMPARMNSCAGKPLHADAAKLL